MIVLGEKFLGASKKLSVKKILVTTKAGRNIFNFPLHFTGKSRLCLEPALLRHKKIITRISTGAGNNRNIQFISKEFGFSKLPGHSKNKL